MVTMLKAASVMIVIASLFLIVADMRKIQEVHFVEAPLWIGGDGNVSSELSIMDVRFVCRINIWKGGKSRAAREVFRGEDSMYDDFLMFHEQAHCLHGDEGDFSVPLSISDMIHADSMLNAMLRGVWKAESAADVFAVLSLRKKYGEASKDFITKLNLLRTTAWLSADAPHFSSPVLTVMLRNWDKGWHEPDIDYATRLSEDVLSGKDLPESEPFEKVFLAHDCNASGDSSSDVSWNEKQGFAIPPLRDLCVLKDFLGDGWKKKSSKW